MINLFPILMPNSFSILSDLPCSFQYQLKYLSKIWLSLEMFIFISKKPLINEGMSRDPRSKRWGLRGCIRARPQHLVGTLNRNLQTQSNEIRCRKQTFHRMKTRFSLKACDFYDLMPQRSNLASSSDLALGFRKKL